MNRNMIFLVVVEHVFNALAPLALLFVTRRKVRLISSAGTR